MTLSCRPGHRQTSTPRTLYSCDNLQLFSHQSQRFIETFLFSNSHSQNQSSSSTVDQLTLSYTVSRSIKPTYTLHFFSYTFSAICSSTKISSIHPLPNLKTPYSSSIKPCYFTDSIHQYSWICFSSHASQVIVYNSYIPSSLLYPCAVEQSQQISSLLALHHFQRPYCTTSTLYHLSSDLILTCRLSILKIPNFYLNLSSLNQLSSEIVASLNPIKATYVDCILLFEYLYFIVHQNNLSISFILDPLLVPSFILLQYPPSLCSPYLLPKLVIPIYTLIHLNSKLFFLPPFCSDVYTH